MENSGECEFDCELFRGNHEGPVRLCKTTKGRTVQAWQMCDKAIEMAKRNGWDVREIKPGENECDPSIPTK